MEPVVFLAQGLVLGFSIAAPVGPIGLLCIRRTLASGAAAGFASGLGAATADGFYGAVAAFGIAAVSDLLVGHQTALRLVGGLVLLWLGISTFRAAPARSTAAVTARGLLGAFFSTAALTVTNPATILSFAAVFGGLGLGLAGNGAASATALVAGVFLGSAAWWLILCLGVSAARRQVSDRVMIGINRCSGLILGAFGAAALASLFVTAPPG